LSPQDEGKSSLRSFLTGNSLPEQAVTAFTLIAAWAAVPAVVAAPIADAQTPDTSPNPAAEVVKRLIYILSCTNGNTGYCKSWVYCNSNGDLQALLPQPQCTMGRCTCVLSCDRYCTVEEKANVDSIQAGEVEE
jgi:hypothetical protein